ncbi:hypothetical protein Pan14r_54880 [Crateriforma conspicua]|uniref:Uncharacterized protein n=1 Tax=Crateriforma conspicua TaxID=2527996 RepID=A0A5C5XQK7_9PLAN|nr:hypothetical protein Pan14r_54880 [Crateriforma conspicua]
MIVCPHWSHIGRFDVLAMMTNAIGSVSTSATKDQNSDWRTAPVTNSAIQIGIEPAMKEASSFAPCFSSCRVSNSCSIMTTQAG